VAIMRVFISAWELKDGAIAHSLTDAIDSLPNESLVPVDERFRCRFLYPDSDQDGLPDKPSIMMIVKWNKGLDAWGELPGVDMLPPFDLRTLIADIPEETINEVITMLGNHGVPYPAIEGSATAGELLDKIIAYYQSSPVSVTAMHKGAEAMFA